MRLGTFLVCALAGSALVVAACSASSTPTDQSGPGNLGGSAGSAGTNAGKGGGAGTGIALACGYCSSTSNAYIPCDGNGQPDVQIVCQQGEICKNGEFAKALAVAVPDRYQHMAEFWNALGAALGAGLRDGQRGGAARVPQRRNPVGPDSG